MELYPPFIIYALKEDYTITTKRSKKSKKRELQKVWIQCDKDGIFKAKGFGKREIITKRNECPFIIIVT